VSERILFKSVALPSEHGGWGLVLEPLVLGLLVAPSLSGFGVGLGVLAGFLLHHPLKLVLADARRRRLYPRTAAALKVAAVYAAAGVAGLVVAAVDARGPWWIPLLAAVPVAALQLVYDTGNRSRAARPEIAGAAALATVAPAELLAAGWAAAPAAALWLLLAGRAVTSVLYVRTRLRRDRGQPVPVTGTLAAHVALVAMAAALTTAGWLTALGVVAAAGLLARAAWGLSPWHRVVRPQVVGFQELGVGVLASLLVALGSR
jgi:hypothetical protein